MAAPYAFEEENYALLAAAGCPRAALDVGCGTGVNGARIRERGARVVGVEHDAPSAAVARRRLDEVIEADITGDAAASALAGRTFDLVVFGDVLEHLPDPLSVLRRFASLLDDGGHVVVSLPNVAAWTVRLDLLRGRFRYQPSGILDRTHLRFFTLESASELIADAGLELMRVDHNPMLIRAARDLIARGVAPPSSDGPVSLHDLPLYRAYRRLVRPAEGKLTRVAPGLLAFQHILVARRRPAAPRPLALAVSLLARDNQEGIARAIQGVRAAAPDAEILVADGSRDRTAEIARALGATVLRRPPRGDVAPLLAEASRRADAVVILDHDGPAEAIPRVRAAIEQGADAVVGRVRGYRSSALRACAFRGDDLLALTAPRSRYRVVG